MIYGVGTDIIETKRVLEACGRKAFLKKVYTKNELLQAGISSDEAEAGAISEDHKGRRIKLKRLASDFAVKEAVSKALRTGFRSFGPGDIECLRDELGAPYIRLHGAAKELSESLGELSIYVSISDSEGMTMAFAVAEKK